MASEQTKQESTDPYLKSTSEKSDEVPLNCKTPFESLLNYRNPIIRRPSTAHMCRYVYILKITSPSSAR